MDIISAPRPSMFFVLFHFRELYWTQTEEQKRVGLEMSIFYFSSYTVILFVAVAMILNY